MITVSSITKNTDRDAVIHTAFLIFLQTLLSIYHIMLLAICTTQVKKRVKKENKKKKVTKNLLQGDSNPHPLNQLELKTNASIHWTSLLSTDDSSLKGVYVPSPW